MLPLGWKRGGALKTLYLGRKTSTLEEVLKLASTGSVRIVNPEGHAFVVEDANALEKGMKLLSKRSKFRRFLKERSAEEPNLSLEDFGRSLDGSATTVASEDK
jgi:hypothetical protein